jgi:peptide/nickel transport system substrate-binding protein
MTRTLWATGVALLATTVTACGMNGGTGGATAAGGGGHLVYAEQLAPAAAWAPETDDAHRLRRAGCLETLAGIGYDSELEPMLATEWNRVEPTTWDITLREGVTFQDGTPMDAEAVAGSLNHLLEVKTPARSFNPDNISKVTATDESTVQITTPEPDALLPLRLASPNTGILAPKAFESAQINIQGTCTGPFTVTEEVPQQSLALEANENYWGGDVALDTAEVRFVVDGGTRATQLQSGEVQIAKSVPVANLNSLEGDSNLEIAQIGLPRTTVMLLNNSRPPFDDPLVRQAIQKAIDTKPIVDGVYEGAGTPAVGPFRPDSGWAPEGAEANTANLDEARSLLDQAGVDPEELTFELQAYIDRPELPDVATVIQAQLAELGVKVEIKSGEAAALEPGWLEGDYDATLLSRGYLTDMADPGGSLLSDWTCKGSYNMAQYCDPETDRMIKEAVALEDEAARAEAYQQIAANLNDEAASIWLQHENAVWGTQAGVKGFQPHPLDAYVLTAGLSLG